jgi:dolichol-phosphate mannosyltransferase
MPELSVVLPCYNEAPVLDQLYDRLSSEANTWDLSYEVVIVDDGSEAETWEKLEDLHQRDDRWKLIRLSRNFGHQTAISAGLYYASGDAVAIMDADLQDPPEVVGRFIEKWREGYEVVYAIRRNRKEGIWKRLAYRTFYRALARVSQPQIPIDSGDFCLMDRQVVDLINAMPEENRFVRGLRAWAGFRQTGVEYERQERAEGDPKYTLSKLVKLAIDGLFSFSTFPLRLATYLGFAVSLIAFLGVVFTLGQGLFPEWFAEFGLEPVPGYTTIVISILFLGGVQLLCLGIVGEYVGRVYDEVKKRPLWVVQETVGEIGTSDAYDTNAIMEKMGYWPDET